jgi:hypothetical protein
MVCELYTHSEIGPHRVYKQYNTVLLKAAFFTGGRLRAQAAHVCTDAGAELRGGGGVQRYSQQGRARY